MSYYGTRAAVGDFGSFGVLALAYCFFCLGLVLLVMVTAASALWWVAKKLVQVVASWLA